MRIKPYFCERCGREYQQDDCLQDGSRLYCFDCPTARLRISGWPLILVGIFVGVMYLIYERIPIETYGSVFVFLPASLGLMAVGVLRLFQAAKLREKTMARKQAEAKEVAEDETPVNVAPADPEPAEGDPTA